MEVLGMIVVIAIILFNIIGIIWLGISLEHPFLVTIAYIVVLVVIGNINGYVCLIVAIAVAVISLLACIIGIVLRCKEAKEEKQLQKEKEQRNNDLLEAVKNGDVESAKMLIEKGGDIEYCDSEKQEPMLQIAIKKSDKEMVSLLLDNGADENCVCNGKTPLDYAKDEEIISILRSHGAKTKEVVALEAVREATIYYGKQEYYMAFKYLQKATDLGNIDALWKLGICYLFGEGTFKDEKRGVELIKKAAEKGHCDAQADIGICYYDGIGVIQNYSESFNWLKKAAEQGVGKAQFRLSICYATGKGTTQNREKAIEWLKKAAEQGDKNAIECLREI